MHCTNGLCPHEIYGLVCIITAVALYWRRVVIWIHKKTGVLCERWGLEDLKKKYGSCKVCGGVLICTDAHGFILTGPEYFKEGFCSESCKERDSDNHVFIRHHDTRGGWCQKCGEHRDGEDKEFRLCVGPKRGSNVECKSHPGVY